MFGSQGQLEELIIGKGNIAKLLLLLLLLTTTIVIINQTSDRLTDPLSQFNAHTYYIMTHAANFCYLTVLNLTERLIYSL